MANCGVFQWTPNMTMTAPGGGADEENEEGGQNYHADDRKQMPSGALFNGMIAPLLRFPIKG